MLADPWAVAPERSRRRRLPSPRRRLADPHVVPAHAALLELQRTVGNRVTALALEAHARGSDDGDEPAAMPLPLQRVVVVGAPGGASVRTRYGVEQAAPRKAKGAHAQSKAAVDPVAQLKAEILKAPYPGWVEAWLDDVLPPLVESRVEYRFDTVHDVVRWLRLREVTKAGLRLLTEAAPTERSQKGAGWAQMYQALEGARGRFAQAGEGDGSFSIFGASYHLERQDVHHYYATREGASEPVQYRGRLRQSDAAVLVMAIARGETAAAPLRDPALIDEFVCAFFAEPTRWGEEQMFNLLALNRTGTLAITSNQAAAVPMASGSTWEPALGEIGREVPLRALSFADAIGLERQIDEVFPASASPEAFARAVLAKRGLTAPNAAGAEEPVAAQQ